MASLSGRADATLVRAATDAAMANVPMDVSKIHERVSKSYAALAESTGKVWGQALKTIGEVGGKLITKAKLEKASSTPSKPWPNPKKDDFEKIPVGQTVIDTADTEIEVKGAGKQLQYQMGSGFGQAPY